MRPGSLAFLAALAVALAALAPAAGASGQLAFNVSTHTFKASVSVPVFNQTVSIPANGTYTINVSLPEGWTASDVAAIYVTAYNATGQIGLAAKDANGSQVASGTIVPLSSGYTQTLPPETATIELSATEAANATIIVYVDSKPVEFALTFDSSELHVEMGGDAWLHGVIKQLAGPAGYVFFDWSIPSPLAGGVYWARDTASPASGSLKTSGAGWSHDVYLHIDASKVDQESNFNVVIHAYYTTGDNGPVVTVATVQLSGVYADSAGGDADGNTARYALYGFGAVVILGLLLLFARKL